MGRISFTLDIWSDQLRGAYLAITAHWIANVEGTSALQLKTALIAFHRLYRRHDGRAIARTVVHLLDRAGVTVKVSRLCSPIMHTHDVIIQGRTFHNGQRIEQRDHDAVPRDEVERA